MEEQLNIRVNLGFRIRWHANQHNIDYSSFIQQLGIFILPYYGGRPQNLAKLSGNSSELCSSQPRPPTAPLWTHHVDGGVWNAGVCALASHTRPTRGARRKLGSAVNRTDEELVNMYRQTPLKSSQEVSRLRWVLLGTTAAE